MPKAQTSWAFGVCRLGWLDQGAFVVLQRQRAKPSSSVATTMSTQVSASFFGGILFLLFDGRLRADAPKRENGPLRLAWVICG